MNTLKTLPLLAMILAISATGASAYDGYDRGDRIDNREARQAARIREGRASGELTRWEAHRLWQEQRRIHQIERWAKRDGFVSREEARRIEQAQDEASRHIRRERHDGQSSWWR
jgi:O-methyltransferase involved in polyketide biosynthesis